MVVVVVTGAEVEEGSVQWQQRVAVVEAVMRLGKTEAADDRRQACRVLVVVYTCDVLAQASQGGRSRKRRGMDISEDLARGRRKKVPADERRGGLPAYTACTARTAYTYLIN